MKLRAGLIAGGLMFGWLAGCGSADDGGGTGGTGISIRYGASVGVIAAKDAGSVQVNGVRFAGTNAEISVGGTVASLDALKPGMVAKVRGSIRADDTGAAESISYRPLIIGPVETVATDRLTVMGQTVLMTAETLCSGDRARDCGQFRVAESVEVSGLVAADGTIHATFVTAREHSDRMHCVQGRVANVDPVANTFRINGLVIYYGAATGDDGVPVDGGVVQAFGRLSPSGRLLATRIVADSGNFSTEMEGDEAALDGLVTAVHGTGRFELDGQAVQTDERTRYGGLVPQEIAVGLRLEVEGTLANGALYAAQIERRH